MRRALHSHFSPREKVKAQFSRWILFWSIMVMCSMQINGQTFGTSECSCISGASSSETGQFNDFITINSNPGETWEVVSATGLFDTSSMAPPAMPIALAPGTEFTEVTPGGYVLVGRRFSGDSFEVVVTDSLNQFTITNLHVCEYPIVEIQGDFGTCIGTTESYSLNVADSLLTNINWVVTGGTIATGQGTSSILVVWDDSPTSGSVQVIGEAAGASLATGAPCDFDITETVDVLSETATVLACNNRINLSVNGSCELTITPSLMLEDMMFTDASYDLIVRDIEADTFINNMTLTGRYAGKDIEVKVIHECSGNSCWGTIRLEDKSIPQLDCGPDVTVDCDQASSPDVTGLPVPDSADITQIDENTFFVDGFDQCGGLTLDFYDEVNSNLCQGPYSSEITRIWLATDIAGNQDTCSSKIFINRATFDDIVFPEIYDDVLGSQPSIPACSGYPETEDGYPHPDFTGRPMGTFCLNVEVSYTDIFIGGCSDESYKIRRRWQVSDLCGVEDDTIYNQIITVMDDVAPVCNAPAEFEVGTAPLSCGASIDVPAPGVVFECSDWDYTVAYKIVDDSNDPFSLASTSGVIRNADSTYTITEIPEGNPSVWIIYTLEDECGNTSQCYTIVNIIDMEEPVPVCDQHTFVALSETGMAFAGPSALDDGSWDNCAVDSMDVRRMDDACGEVSAWGQRIKFCCEDVGTPVMVALRVFDAAGNMNQCMVEVEVQDNIPPVITSTPDDVTVNCLENVDFLAKFGTITAEDNCGFTISESEDRSNEDCGRGEIIRTFTATDVFGNASTHQQVITIENLDPFFIDENDSNSPTDDVIWPRDYTVDNGCVDTGVEPEDLPAVNGFPQTFENQCSQVNVTHEDVVFQYVDQACFKILRTWTIIDWCQYNPFFPQDGGKWYYTQVIKVNNNVAPVIETGCRPEDITITQLDGCRANYSISATGSDDCTPSDRLKWFYEVDLGDNGIIDYSGVGSSFTRTDDFATLRVIWTVEDQCGNTSSCEGRYTLEDTKPPTPYCISEIVTVLMETDGTVEIWAEDFDNGSFDNCSSVQISFSADVNETAKTFTCADIMGNATTIPVEIWVTDESGNQDFCQAELTLQDNSNACPDDPNGNNRVAIQGQISTEDNRMVEEVEVMIMANIETFPAYEMTDQEGKYAFTDLGMYEDYIIEPTMEGEASEGVTTLDLVLIQRHILGLARLDSPYKVIAADVNNTESVTGSDIVALRKLILGITDAFPNNESWRFVDGSKEFTDITNPFPFDEKIGYASLEQDMMETNFIAVKVGDVNNSAVVNSFEGNTLSENRSTLTLNSELLSETDHKAYAKVSLNRGSELAGMQFTLSFDADELELETIYSSDIEINNEHIGWGAIEMGKALVSWNTAQTPRQDEVTFIVEFTKKNAEASLESFDINNDLMEAEAYTVVNGIVETNTILFNRDQSLLGAQDFKLYQNVPNPFNASTEISFDLPEAGRASLKVFDLNGKLITEINGNYEKGFNTISLNINDLNATGILYYQLDSKTHTASRKMVVIK